MKGYVIVDGDKPFKNHVYKVGKTLKVDGELIFNVNGIHFFKDFFYAYLYNNNKSGKKKLLEVESKGKISHRYNVYITDVLYVKSEIKDIESFILEQSNNYIGNNDFSRNVSSYQKLSEDFILTNIKILDWPMLSYGQKFSLNFYKNYKDKLDWSFISQYKKMDLDFLRMFEEYIDWDIYSSFQNLTDEIVNSEFQTKLNWDNISLYFGLNEKIQKKYGKYLNWDIIKEREIKSKSKNYDNVQNW